MPELILVPFQGSDSCTSESVEKVFIKAEKLANDSTNFSKIPVIVFDEIGLAEISIHNPLKVLHKYLEHENKKIGFIGVSN